MSILFGLCTFSPLFFVSFFLGKNWFVALSIQWEIVLVYWQLGIVALCFLFSFLYKLIRLERGSWKRELMYVLKWSFIRDCSGVWMSAEIQTHENSSLRDGFLQWKALKSNKNISKCCNSSCLPGKIYKNIFLFLVYLIKLKTRPKFLQFATPTSEKTKW